MSVCDKCWADAYLRMRCDPSKPQIEHYRDLLRERQVHPCPPTQKEVPVDSRDKQ